jgi:hypothetical protein
MPSSTIMDAPLPAGNTADPEETTLADAYSTALLTVGPLAIARVLADGRHHAELPATRLWDKRCFERTRAPKFNLFLTQAIPRYAPCMFTRR